MKPVNLNQLLFHPKSDVLSFYVTSETKVDTDIFLDEIKQQLLEQEKPLLEALFEKFRTDVKKVLKRHPDKSHGFYLSDQLTGYVVLEQKIEPYHVIGETFHVRPLMEEILTNPEFILVNISLYDVKIYRGDFNSLEVIQQYEFDQLPKNFSDTSRLYAPQNLGLIPYKTILAIKTIAQKVKDYVLYQSLPVVVTGLADMKNLFLRYFDSMSGVISHFDEDFYEKTCVEVVERCKRFRFAITDYYSAQLKERLKRMIKSKRFLTDLGDIIKATYEGRIIHLVIPSEQKIWGKIDEKKGEYTIHKKIGKTSVDILNEIAEEVMRQGGRIQILGPHFFPQNSLALAVVKGPV